MKYTIQHITSGEEELILKYRNITPEIARILEICHDAPKKLIGWKEKMQTVIAYNEILYIESVDGKTFAYTERDVLKLDYVLNRLETLLSDINFFRCSKSMIMNIDKVKYLKSLPSNRIEATMCNDERIIITRTYASNFRKRLKGGI